MTNVSSVIYNNLRMHSMIMTVSRVKTLLLLCVANMILIKQHDVSFAVSDRCDRLCEHNNFTYRDSICEFGYNTLWVSKDMITHAQPVQICSVHIFSQS